MYLSEYESGAGPKCTTNALSESDACERQVVEQAACVRPYLRHETAKTGVLGFPVPRPQEFGIPVPIPSLENGIRDPSARLTGIPDFSASYLNPEFP